MKLSPPELRALLNELFLRDTDFDAFCSDHFPDVANRRFSNGMDRVQKTTLLLSYADPEKLTALLREAQRELGVPPGGEAVRPADGGRIKVLFLAANPTSTRQLDLTREARQIEERIGVGKPREALAFVARWAVRSGDLQRALLEERPHVLHFSGHGSARGQLLVEDDHGAAVRLDKEALADLVDILSDNLRLVVLNACDSEPQAEALVRHVDCAIGMHEPITDDAAIAFAGSFYQALGFGQSVATAFRLGCNELRVRQIPQEQTPRLKVKAGLDAATLVLAGPR